MGLSKFKQAIAGKALDSSGDPESREAWNGRWQRKIYPFWQTPIALLAAEPGIANVLSRLHHPTPTLLNYDDLVASFPASWEFGADVYVQTADGLPDAFMLYVFGQDGGMGVIMRVGVTVDQAAIADLSTCQVWKGAVADIVKQVAGDVPAAAAMVDGLLVAAIRQRDERIAAEKAAAEALAKEQAERKAKEAAEQAERAEQEAAAAKAKAEEASAAAAKANTNGGTP